MARRRFTWSTVGILLLAVVTAVMAFAALQSTASAPAPKPEPHLGTPSSEAAVP